MTGDLNVVGVLALLAIVLMFVWALTRMDGDPR